MGNLASKLEAMLRGGGQGATAGWGDEGVAKILANLPMPDDGGIPREYGAGSAEQDYLNTERGANAESERRFPGSYHSGEALGATPAMMVGGAGGGIAGAGLMGALRGGVSGAGHAEEGSRLKGAATSAGPSALLSMAGAAAPGALKNLMGSFPGGPPTSGLAPAYAGVGASVGQEAAQEGLPFINMMSTTPAKRGPGMAGRARPLPPDERIIKQDQEDWALRNPEAANQTPNVGKPAIPPKAPGDPAEAYVPDIPKNTKAWPQSLDRAFDDIEHADNAYAKQAGQVGEQLEVRQGLREGGVLPKLRNLADPRDNPELMRQDPTWREMEAEISKRNNPPAAPMNEVKIPKQAKLPDLERENALAEDHARLQEGIDAIKKRNKGTIQKTKEIQTPVGPGTERQTLKVQPGEVEKEDIRSLMGTLPL